MWARAAVSSEAQMRETPILNWGDCWQDSVPADCWTEGLSSWPYGPLQHGSLLQQSQQGTELARRTEVTVSGSLITEVPSHHFCCVWQTRSRSLGHSMCSRRRLPKSMNTEKGIIWGQFSVSLPQWGSCESSFQVLFKIPFPPWLFKSPLNLNPSKLTPVRNGKTWIVLGGIMLFCCSKKMFFLIVLQYLVVK